MSLVLLLVILGMAPALVAAATGPAPSTEATEATGGDDTRPDATPRENRPPAIPPESLTIIFQGNRALPDARLQEAAPEELAGYRRHGRATAIDDAAYLMQLAYRRAGYHFAAVDYRIAGPPSARQVFFIIEEGPLVRLGTVSFNGNRAFSDRELLALVEERLQAGAGVVAPPLPFVESRFNEALSRMRELYLNEGYREVRISLSALRFRPEAAGGAGPAGIKTADSGGPTDRQPPGNERPVAGARMLADIEVEINEGQRLTIAAVRLSAPPPPAAAAATEQALALTTAELLGQPYFTRRKLVLHSRLLEALQEAGYPEAQIQIHDLAGDRPGDIVLLAELDAGPRVRIAEIEVSGQRRSSPRFIKRRLALEPGDIYRDSARRQSFNELYRSGLFTRIDFTLAPPTGPVIDDEEPQPPDEAMPPQPALTPPLAKEMPAAGQEDPLEDRVLRVRVEEGRSRELFLAGGWGSYEMLRARMGFTDRNLFRHGRILRLELGGSLKGAEVQAGITDPWLLESRISAEFPVFYRIREEPSFTRTESGLGLLFSRPFAHNVTASLGYQLRRSDISKIEAAAASESLESGYGIASLKFQLSRDTRNDIFFPTAGQRLYGAVETADPLLGSDLAFYRFSGGFRHFRALSPKLTLGLRADTGLILPGRDQIAIPLGERFYSGGENSVRSFREGGLGPKDLAGRPVGGMAFNTLSLELRRRLGQNLALSLFTDYGNLSPNRSRAEEGKGAATERSEVIKATLGDYFSDFRPALGAGLQYLLPVGPARLDLAFNPARRSDRHEPAWVAHFSLGMAF